MSGPNGERNGRQLKIAKCKQTFAQMEKRASDCCGCCPPQYFGGTLARVQKFCLRDTRKCDDSGEKEERGRAKRERGRELRGQLRPEKLGDGGGGLFLPLSLSHVFIL